MTVILYFRIDAVQGDLSALKQNIQLVNREMEKNNLEIQKLENCVQVQV